MKHTVSEKVGYWIDAAIDEHGQGENILWEGALMPSQQGDPLYIVFVWFPGAALGTALNGSFAIDDPLHTTKESISGLMVEFLHQLREARSQIMAQQMPQQAATPPRGAQTPSGLLIP